MAARSNEIKFKNPKFEVGVRQSLGKLEGVISAEDLCSVKMLDASNYTFQAEDLKTLCQCKNLEELNICISEIPLDFLKEFQHLRELDMEYYPDKENAVDLAPLASLRELEYLFVSGGDDSCMKIINTEALTGLTKLTNLRFHEFGTVDLKFLEGMPWIKDFFCGYGSRVDNIASIGYLTKLESLDLTDIEMDNLDFLRTLPDSMELTLCGNLVRDGFDMSELSRFKELDACEWRVNIDGVWRWVEEMPNGEGN